MLFLLFQIGNDRYALDATQVAIVLPLARCKKVPGAPGWVEGVFNYCDRMVPVLDINMLAAGKPAAVRLSTRLVLVHYTPPGQAAQLLGLIVEKASEMLRCDPDTFVDSGLNLDDTPYLGPVMRHPNGLVQRIEVQDLLDESVKNMLFPQESAA